MSDKAIYTNIMGLSFGTIIITQFIYQYPVIIGMLLMIAVTPINIITINSLINNESKK